MPLGQYEKWRTFFALDALTAHGDVCQSHMVKAFRGLRIVKKLFHMNPFARNGLMLQSLAKVRRLEAGVERMADVFALIVTLADTEPVPFMPAETLNEIARLGRAALVGATPPEHGIR
jgi:hypothetical protein